MRRNWVRFKNGLARGQSALEKCRKNRAEKAGNRAEDGGRRAEERRILERGERPWTEKVGASDALACQGFIPERCVDGLDRSRAEGGERRTEEMDIADGESVVVASEPAGGEAFTATDDGSEGENVANEPKADEGISTPQLQIKIGVEANSGVDSGLDNELKTNPRPGFGEEEDHVSDSGSDGLEFPGPSHCVERQPSPAAAAPARVERDASLPPAAPGLRKERTAPPRATARSLRKGRKANRKKMAKRELERRIREQIDGSGSVREGYKLIEDLQAMVVEEFRLLQPSVPRAP